MKFLIVRLNKMSWGGYVTTNTINGKYYRVSWKKWHESGAGSMGVFMKATQLPSSFKYQDDESGLYRLSFINDKDGIESGLKILEIAQCKDKLEAAIKQQQKDYEVKLSKACFPCCVSLPNAVEIISEVTLNAEQANNLLSLIEKEHKITRAVREGGTAWDSICTECESVILKEEKAREMKEAQRIHAEEEKLQTEVQIQRIRTRAVEGKKAASDVEERVITDLKLIMPLSEQVGVLALAHRNITKALDELNAFEDFESIMSRKNLQVRMSLATDIKNFYIQYSNSNISDANILYKKLCDVISIWKEGKHEVMEEKARAEVEKKQTTDFMERQSQQMQEMQLLLKQQAERKEVVTLSQSSSSSSSPSSSQTGDSLATTAAKAIGQGVCSEVAKYGGELVKGLIGL